MPAADRNSSGRGRSAKVVPKDKTQIGAYVDNQVLSDAKDAVVFLQAAGAETPVNLSELITQALRREVDRLAGEHHAGQPFPARTVELQPGRRAGN